VLAALVVWMFWPSRKQADESPGIAGLNAKTGRVGGAKGFPVPPLNLEVPPSPRAQRVLVGRSARRAAVAEGMEADDRETVPTGKES
jgi:hypothetical protein